jgi:hypothetical protein
MTRVHARELITSIDENVSTWPEPLEKVVGRARQLCPGTSDLGFLGDFKRVVDLKAEVALRCFDLRVAE